MVQSVATRSIVSFQTRSASPKAAAQTALIATGDGAYTSAIDRGNGFSVANLSEAHVNINPVTTTGGVSRTTAPDVRPATETQSSEAKLVSPTDEVTLSTKARELLAAEGADQPASSLRAERVAQIKAEIEASTYDTDEKFDAAVERMLDELA